MKTLNYFFSLFFSIVSLAFVAIHPAFAKEAKEASGIMDAYKAEQVSKHGWVVFGPLDRPNVKNQGFMNNPGFIITDKSVIVIDPGSTVHVGNALLEKIRKQTDKPVTHIFNTHIHGDHWLGNQAFYEAYPDVKIYAHPEMIKEAKAGEAESWISLMDTLTEGASKGTKVVLPTLALEDGQQVKVDNITVKAHLTEIAHTKTDAMFEIVEDKLFFTGDNGFNTRMPRLEDGSFRGNMGAMDLAMKLPIETIIPGHGAKGGKEILSNFKEFLEILYGTTKTLYEDDMEAFEMKPVVVEKMDKYKSWVGFDDGIGKLISIALLEAENDE